MVPMESGDFGDFIFSSIKPHYCHLHFFWLVSVAEQPGF